MNTLTKLEAEERGGALMSTNTNLDPRDLWSRTVNEIKKKILQPSLWQALEAVVPITLEGDLLVLGLPSELSHFSSYVHSSDNRKRIEAVLEELTGQHLNVRVIDGAGLEDWDLIKQREAIASQAQQTRLQQRAREALLEASWETLSEQVYSLFTRIPLRQLPQNRARYLKQAVATISDFLNKIPKPKTPDEEERYARYLARVLDKVANLADVTGTVVALELERYRKEQNLD